MQARLARVLGTAAVFGIVLIAHAGAGNDVSGQKLDNGLGSLPHYSKWLDKSGRDPMGHRVLGESLDDGLGELPHYSKWADRSGRDPMGIERRMVGLNDKR
jgi:hypothetical protein